MAHEEFRLAQICGLNLMIIPDEIEELIRVYERRGFFEQLISMMESGTNLRHHIWVHTWPTHIQVRT